MIQLSMISNQVGLGFTYVGAISQEDIYLSNDAVKINSKELNVGEKTNLYGRFEVPLRYAGKLKNHLGTIIAFHLGETKNQYEEVTQYYCCYIVEQENKIVNMSSSGVYKKYLYENNKWNELYN